MTNVRLHELLTDWNARITPEEAAEGWHFCDDWDGLLVHPTMQEYEACGCNIPYKRNNA